MHALIVQTGKHKGRRIELPERAVVIGRDETCFIRMTSQEVSRQHCALTPTERGLVVRDLGSQNGTLVNGARIEHETVLQPGDVLKLGPLQFLVAIERPKEEQSIEEDVLGWLSESDTATELANTSDTTIVKAQHVEAARPEAKPTFRTIAEEARDIIREWEERERGGPQAEGKNGP
jgi:pSer/pThr/pTyr-binding forkhead associated (FHA) protein